MAFEFTDKNFKQEALDSTGLTVVDFGAEWCGPCRTLAPIVEKLAKDYEGTVKIGKLDVDNNPETAIKYGVRSIPTLLFLRDGVKVHQEVGAPTATALKAKIDSLMTVTA